LNDFGLAVSPLTGPWKKFLAFHVALVTVPSANFRQKPPSPMLVPYSMPVLGSALSLASTAMVIGYSGRKSTLTTLCGVNWMLIHGDEAAVDVEHEPVVGIDVEFHRVGDAGLDEAGRASFAFAFAFAFFGFGGGRWRWGRFGCLGSDLSDRSDLSDAATAAVNDTQRRTREHLALHRGESSSRPGLPATFSGSDRA
jgi:hypothetical protein